MPVDFDIGAFIENCRGTKPPYPCPVQECGAVYKTFQGIRGHMEKSHGGPSASTTSDGPAGASFADCSGVAAASASAASGSPDRTGASLSTSEQQLTYEESQRYVTFELEGRTVRWPIEEPLHVCIVTQEDAASVSGEPEASNNTATGSPSPNDVDSTSQSTTGKPGKPGKPGKTGKAGKAGRHNQQQQQQPHKPRAPRASSVVPGQPASPPGKIPSPRYELVDPAYQLPKRPATPECYIRYIEKSAEELDELVEYDLDEEDDRWLAAINDTRRERLTVNNRQPAPVREDAMELLMDRFEKEAHFRSTGDHRMEDDDAVCTICLDGECYNTNAILFCDMCNLAVHQECYGIPYVPEASWLCRRCLQCPSESPQCILCPNRGGAFKMTTDNRWCHVVCALWIPEVIFSNTVFLEPVDNIEKIPAARWKLACYICKQRNVGACIQCHKTNCYTAFHVTCALQAGLYMRIEGVRDGSAADGIRKTALCDAHSPSEPKPGNASAMYAATTDEEDASAAAQHHKSNVKQQKPSPEKVKRQKMRRARKILAERRNAVPGVSVPVISKDRLAAIGELLPEMPDREDFLRRLYNYWRLKRQARSGVPLLKRLQACRARDFVANDRELQQLCKQLKFWQRLRQDLEKARLLAELVRKRERIKRELVRARAAIAEVSLTPRVALLKQLHSALTELDTQRIFAEPVDLPAYREAIKRPMDFSTMLSKIECNQYASVAEYHSDFDLMLANCHAFNRKDSIYCRAANRLQSRSQSLFSDALAAESAADYDSETGLHRWQLAPTNNSTSSPTASPTRPLTRRSISQDSASTTSTPTTAQRHQPRRTGRLGSSCSAAAAAAAATSPISSADATNNRLFEEEESHSDAEGADSAGGVGDTVFTEFIG
uniref:Bromodomain and PHD finger containing, 1 n=1 Tax=Macrostomum lignano TaxID=282301 RepID=A0A1I8GU50_9PLAT